MTRELLQHRRGPSGRPDEGRALDGGRALPANAINCYGGVFEQNAGSVTELIARDVNTETAESLRSGKPGVDFLDHDLSLNGR